MGAFTGTGGGGDLNLPNGRVFRFWGWGRGAAHLHDGTTHAIQKLLAGFDGGVAKEEVGIARENVGVVLEGVEEGDEGKEGGKDRLGELGLVGVGSFSGEALEVDGFGALRVLLLD